MNVDRRTFVKRMSLAVMGSATGCVSASKELGSQSSTETPEESYSTQYETTSIPVLKSGDEVVATKQVPVKWNNLNKKAEKINERLQAKYADTNAVRMIGIGNAEKTIGEYHYPKIEIGVAPGHVKEMDEKIPDEIDGIPVKVKEQEEIHAR